MSIADVPSAILYPQFSQEWVDDRKPNGIVLTAGKHRKCRLLDVDGEKFVYRDLPPQIVEKGPVNEMEYYMMTESAKRGIAPRVLAASEDRSWVIIEYIPGGTITLPRAQQHCEAIGKALKIAHEIPLFRDDGRPLDYADQKKWRAINALAPLDTALYYSLMETFTKAYNLYKRGMDSLSELHSDLKVNIHVDLHPRNLFWADNRFQIIDWEHATHGHPYYDVASLTILFDLDETQEAELLRGYFGSDPTVDQMSEYKLLKGIRWAHMAFINAYGALLKLPESPDGDVPAPDKTFGAYIKEFAASIEPTSLEFSTNVSRLALEQAKRHFSE